MYTMKRSTLMACVSMVVMVGAAIEVYDEALPGDMELMYQDYNYIDTGPIAPELNPEDPVRSILLYKMLNSLRNRDTSPSVLSGPKWIPSGPVLVPPDALSYHLKSPIMKRLTDLKTPKNVKPAPRPQQKWKIKKGKAGSQMICYFKLCAFRSPV